MKKKTAANPQRFLKIVVAFAKKNEAQPNTYRRLQKSNLVDTLYLNGFKNYKKNTFHVPFSDQETFSQSEIRDTRGKKLEFFVALNHLSTT